MGFNLREKGLFTGEPIGLIRIEHNSKSYRYATGDRDVQLNSEAYFYAPGGVSRSAIQDSSQRAKNQLTITLPIDLPVAELWLPYPRAGAVFVDCLAIHAGDSDYAVEWTGRVIGTKFFDTKIELQCEPSRSVTKSRGSNLRWQRGCPLALYSQGIGMCNVDKELKKVLATVTAFSGITITATGLGPLPSGRLAGGFVQWIRPDGEYDRRSITRHQGTQIDINYGADSIAVGTQIEAYPGCAHNWDDCDGFFDNSENYGGVLTIPTNSPHDGNPVQ